MSDILIRSEKVSDIAEIERIIRQAFGQQQEATLVNKLRDSGALTFSLVAENKHTKELLGHIALSIVSIEGEQRSWQALGLAPVSVKPEYQSHGIGSALINDWFKEYADDFYNAIVLLGDPNYYQRFGFLKAADFGLYWGDDSFKETFQVREIKNGFLNKAAGQVFYHEAFLAL